jgi:hypothetical protein
MHAGAPGKDNSAAILALRGCADERQKGINHKCAKEKEEELC